MMVNVYVCTDISHAGGYVYVLCFHDMHCSRYRVY